MNSLGRECNELKGKYDACFNVWFSEKFLKGDTNEDMCKPLFIVYRDCVRVRLKRSQLSILNNFCFLNKFICRKLSRIKTSIWVKLTDKYWEQVQKRSHRQSRRNEHFFGARFSSFKCGILKIYFMFSLGSNSYLLSFQKFHNPYPKVSRSLFYILNSYINLNNPKRN